MSGVLMGGGGGKGIDRRSLMVGGGGAWTVVNFKKACLSKGKQLSQVTSLLTGSNKL